MKQDLQQFIKERAEQLAVVHLTRRQDLDFERMTANYGFDLLVTILQNSLPTGRVFGIQVKGRDSAIKRLQDELLASTQTETNYLRDVPFPLCIFLFTMEDDKGYYRWAKYPLSEAALGSHSLGRNQWQPLDDNGLNQIVEDVNAWYNAKSAIAS